MNGWLTERNMACVTRHAGNAAASRWSRVCRWQVGMATGPSPWLCSLAVLVFWQVMACLVSPEEPSRGMMIGFTLFLPLVFPMVFMIGQSTRRFRTLGRELLLPVDRGAYLRQLGAALAVCQLHVWAVMTGVLVAWWLLTASEPVAWGRLACGLPISVLLQIWIFGVHVWLARYRSVLWSALGLYAASTPLPLFFLLPAELGGLGPIALAVAGVLALLGVLIMWDAYRRWLVTELG
jgi:hypothetical protein